MLEGERERGKGKKKEIWNKTQSEVEKKTQGDKHVKYGNNWHLLKELKKEKENKWVTGKSG